MFDEDKLFQQEETCWVTNLRKHGFSEKLRGNVRRGQTLPIGGNMLGHKPKKAWFLRRALQQEETCWATNLRKHGFSKELHATNQSTLEARMTVWP